MQSLHDALCTNVLAPVVGDGIGTVLAARVVREALPRGHLHVRVLTASEVVQGIPDQVDAPIVHKRWLGLASHIGAERCHPDQCIFLHVAVMGIVAQHCSYSLSDVRAVVDSQRPGTVESGLEGHQRTKARLHHLAVSHVVLSRLGQGLYHQRVHDLVAFFQNDRPQRTASRQLCGGVQRRSCHGRECLLLIQHRVKLECAQNVCQRLVEVQVHLQQRHVLPVLFSSQ
mmetsp:Transcript_42558/g.98658  ORF Transcript_42558/g.98658 Transcript_42558/m.98658 type:complete len:228 (+) Transcript_42558:678-1361(+)